MSYSIGAAKKSKEEIIKDKIRKLWVTLDEDIVKVESGRISWGFAGPPKTWKSMTAALSIYFNSYYAEGWKEDYPNAYRLLKSGEFYEIEKICVLDTEFSWRSRFIRIKKNRDLLLDAIKNGRIQLMEVYVEDPKSAKRSSDESRILLEEAVGALGDEPGTTAIIIDSMSCYKIDLDNSLAIKVGADKVDPASIKQKYYAWRNNEWVNTMKALRRVKGNVIATFKTSQEWDTEDWGYKEGIENRYILWVDSKSAKTDYWIDNTVMFDVEIMKDGTPRSRVTFMPDIGCAYMPKKMSFLLPSGRYAFIALMDTIADSVI